MAPGFELENIPSLAEGLYPALYKIKERYGNRAIVLFPENSNLGVGCVFDIIERRFWIFDGEKIGYVREVREFETTVIDTMGLTFKREIVRQAENHSLPTIAEKLNGYPEGVIAVDGFDSQADTIIGFDNPNL